MRADLQTQLDILSADLKHALEKISSQERDLELMCEDLAAAEHTNNITRSTVQLLQAESAAHRHERELEAAEIGCVLERQKEMEWQMQCLEKRLTADKVLDEDLHRQKRLLQHELDGAIARAQDLECDLASARAKLIESEESVVQMRSDMQRSVVNLTQLRVQFADTLRECNAANGQIASLQVECKQAQARLEQTEAALNQRKHELSESKRALSRIFEVACRDPLWLGDAVLEVNHVIEDEAAASGQVLPKPGHILLQIDDHDVSVHSDDEIMEMLSGPVGSSVRLVAQSGLEGAPYEAYFVRKATNISNLQSVCRKASGVCQVIHSLREEIRSLQQAHSRSTFDAARRLEFEQLRNAGMQAAITCFVTEIDSIGNDLRTERACANSNAAQFQALQAERRLLEQKLMLTVDELENLQDLLLASRNLVQQTLQHSNVKVEHLKLALESEQKGRLASEVLVNKTEDMLAKLKAQHNLNMHQADEWKEKFCLKNQDWELLRAKCEDLRQHLATCEQDLKDAKAFGEQMHRAVCGRFKKSGIGLKLRAVEANFSADSVAVVEEIVPGGPAETSGKLQVGDLVLAIDGTKIGDIPADSFRSMLTGPLGTSITMTLRRNVGHPERKYMDFDLTLVRRIPTVDKQTMAGQAVDVSDCAHAFFIEMQQISGQCAAASATVEEQIISMTNAQEMNERLRAEIRKGTEDSNKQRHKINMLEEELVKAQAAARSKDRNWAQMVQERDKVKVQLADADEKIRRLGVQLEELRRERQVESTRQQQSVKESAGRIADLKGCLATRDNQASMMKLEIERLKGESKRYLLESESVKKQILLLRDTHEEMKGLLLQSRAENNRLLEHLESEKRRSEAMESRLALALAGSQRLDREKAGVSSNLAELQDKYDENLVHTKSMLEQMEQAHQELESQTADLLRLETEKQTLEQAVSEGNASLEQALREIEEFKEEAQRASERLKTELKNAEDVVQEQAQMHAMVLKVCVCVCARL